MRASLEVWMLLCPTLVTWTNLLSATTRMTATDHQAASTRLWFTRSSAWLHLINSNLLICRTLLPFSIKRLRSVSLYVTLRIVHKDLSASLSNSKLQMRPLQAVRADPVETLLLLMVLVQPKLRPQVQTTSSQTKTVSCLSDSNSTNKWQQNFELLTYQFDKI